MEEIESEDGNRIPNINFILDIGQGKVEELTTYNQVLDHLGQAEAQDNSINQELYRFRAISGHEGPLKVTETGKGASIMFRLDGKWGDHN